MSLISFEIKEKIGVLSETNSGWTKELRRINWNGRGDKLDIREWSPDQRKMSRGITLSLREALALKEMLEMVKLDLELELEEEDEGRREKQLQRQGEAVLTSSSEKDRDNSGLPNEDFAASDKRREAVKTAVTWGKEGAICHADGLAG